MVASDQLHPECPKGQNGNFYHNSSSRTHVRDRRSCNPAPFENAMPIADFQLYQSPRAFIPTQANPGHPIYYYFRLATPPTPSELWVACEKWDFSRMDHRAAKIQRSSAQALAAPPHLRALLSWPRLRRPESLPKNADRDGLPRGKQSSNRRQSKGAAATAAAMETRLLSVSGCWSSAGSASGRGGGRLRQRRRKRTLAFILQPRSNSATNTIKEPQWIRCRGR